MFQSVWCVWPAGEIGSHLGNDQEVQYYDAVAAYAGLKAGDAAAGAQPGQHLSGWIWSGYSNGEGHVDKLTARANLQTPRLGA